MPANKDNTVDVAIGLDKQSAAEYARGIGQSQSLTESFVTSADKMGTVAQKSGDRVAAAFKAQAQMVANETENLKQLRAEYIKTADAADNLGDVQEKSKGSFGVESVRRIGGAANQLFPESDIGPLIQRVGDAAQIGKEFAAQVDLVSVATKAASGGFVEMATSLGPVTLLLTAVAAAGLGLVSVLKSLDDKAREATQGLQGVLNTQQKYYDIVVKGTSETARKAISEARDNNKISAEIAKENLKIITDFAQQVGDEVALAMNPVDRARTISGDDRAPKIIRDAADAYLKLSQTLTDNDVLVTRLTGDLKNGAFAMNDAIAATEKYADAQAALGKAEADAEAMYNKERIDALFKAQEEEKARLKEMATVQKKYNDDVQGIEDNSLQARTDLAQKFADAQIAIAERAVEASEAALDRLQQKYQDLQTGLDRDIEKSVRDANDKLLDDQIKAQRQERDDLEQHLQNLKQIRDRDASRERDDQLNRNYRDIFALRESQAQDMSSEAGQFKKQQEKQQRALSEGQSDQDRAFDIARRERLIAYGQAQEDAQSQYKRDLDLLEESKTKQLRAAQVAYNKDLTALINKTNDELRIKHNGYVAELTLASKTSAERIAIEKKTQDALLNQANNTLAKVQSNMQGTRKVTAGTPVLRQFAQGGFAEAFTPIEVNEPGSTGNEGFGALRFPGHGIFMPFRSGNVDSGKGGSVNNISLTINESNNPMRTKQAVYAVFKEVGFTR